MFVSPALGDGYRWIPNANWSASFAEMANFRFNNILFQRNKVEISKGRNQCASLASAHGYASLCTCAHKVGS